MALDNQVDNQGIKKGLGLVVSQLIQSNQKLDSQESGNLFKELRQNNRLTEQLLSEKLKDDTPKERILDQTPEIAADVLISRKEMKLEQALSDKDPTDRLLNLIAFTTSDQFKFSTRYYTEMLRIQQVVHKRQLKNHMSITKMNKEERKDIGVLAGGFFEEVKDRKKTQTGVLRQIKMDIGLKKKEIEFHDESRKKEKKDNEKLSKDEQKSMFTRFMDLKNSLGEKLTNLGNTLKKPFTALSTGLKKLTSMFPRFFGGIGFALKTIGAILLIGGLYKFLSSQTWQKMKPNIAESIGNGLEMMDFAVQKIYSITTEYIIPALMSLYNGIVFVLDMLGIVRKDQRTYDAEAYDSKTASIRARAEKQLRTAMSGTQIGLIGEEMNERAKANARKNLAKASLRDAQREEKLAAMHFKRREAYVTKMMNNFGMTRAEALAEYREQHEGHIGGISPSNIGMIQDYTNPSFTGGGGNMTIINQSKSDKISYNSSGQIIATDTFIANMARLNND